MRVHKRAKIKIKTNISNIGFQVPVPVQLQHILQRWVSVSELKQLRTPEGFGKSAILLQDGGGHDGADSPLPGIFWVGGPANFKLCWGGGP